MRNISGLEMLTYEELDNRADGGDRYGTLSMNYDEVRSAFDPISDEGKNFSLNGHGDDRRFLDDDCKCDVSFAIRDPETGGTVLFWNYKNGPVYNPGELTLSDICEFSAGFMGSDQDADEALLDRLNSEH